MTIELETGLYIFILAGFLGFYVISRVPPLLHTPLMSATNAISGISLVGSLVVAGAAHSFISTLLGFAAVVCASINVVGGFLITDRMLKMFRTGEQQTGEAAQSQSARRVLLVCIALLVSILSLSYWLQSQKAAARNLDLSEWMKLAYILAAALFILGLKGLSSPRSARKGMFLAELGMILAVVGTLFHQEIVTYQWTSLGLILGSAVGAGLGLWIPMTAVPQRTAFSHALGALAATLIGISEYIRYAGQPGKVLMAAIGLEVIIGGLTFTGSLMAAGKLQEILPGAPITYKGQNASNFTLLGLMLGTFVYLIFIPSAGTLFYVMVALALLFGFLLVVPIGAADMPVVISLLNSYAGLASASMGFVLMNKIQIITGALDGTSGFLLSLLMCRAMNRSAMNVLFGAFGKVEKEEKTAAEEAKGIERFVQSIVAEEVPELLDGARSVIIVPGYGMAVAQAQHSVSQLANLLMKRGVDVKYAIHPVAGRMPGHMNVLLAEAEVPYEQLYEMEQINPYFPQADLAIVIGANDTTNPAARYDKTSPLYGMPILEVDRARAIIVLKRSMRPGFAGVDNELYHNPRCMMLFGDARESLNKLFAVLKG